MPVRAATVVEFGLVVSLKGRACGLGPLMNGFPWRYARVHLTQFGGSSTRLLSGYVQAMSGRPGPGLQTALLLGRKAVEDGLQLRSL
jgi:hypothetical protein